MNKYYNFLNENENYDYIKIKLNIIKDCFKYIIKNCYCTKKCYNKYIDRLTSSEQILEPLVRPDLICELCDIQFNLKKDFDEHLDKFHMNNDSTMITDL